jgi:argininosuccinate lyase
VLARIPYARPLIPARFLFPLKPPFHSLQDLQEDKEPLFDTLTTTSDSVRIATGVLSTLTINPPKMIAALTLPMLATDLSDHLVRQGVPFREAHSVAGGAVSLAETRDCNLDEVRRCSKCIIGPSLPDLYNYPRSIQLPQINTITPDLYNY